MISHCEDNIRSHDSFLFPPGVLAELKVVDDKIHLTRLEESVENYSLRNKCSGAVAQLDVVGGLLASIAQPPDNFVDEYASGCSFMHNEVLRSPRTFEAPI